jgi:cellulose synthase/poly-beta-1,6-N-acetylglucosamine synthase-like glycosyltransferase
MSGVFWAYGTVLSGLAVFGFYRLIYAGFALSRRAAPEAPQTFDCPAVLVQLPIYNEAYVAERLLRACAALDYPQDRRDIQVLDDSTDATQAIVNRVVRELRLGGTRISVVRRPDRTGFKAGALAWGLEAARDAAYVAIFDADFVPPPDFLKATMPRLLANPKVGMVQARWGHLNREVSLLTRAQALFLDGHFAVEHQARLACGHFFNFNGTAGIWRRTAIDSAGGWSADTITEDLDLSYRAQLAGWRFDYVDALVAPAELPESWSAFRSQQSRWVRGSIETARKHLIGVLRCRQLSWWARLDAAVHLLNNFAYLLMLILALLLPIALVARFNMAPVQADALVRFDLLMLGLGTMATVLFYLVAAYRVQGRLSWKHGVEVGVALCVGAGMCLSNAIQVLRGLLAGPSDFVRTPKRGTGSPYSRTVDPWRDTGSSEVRVGGPYRSPTPYGLVLLECLLAVYYLAGLGFVWMTGMFAAIPFLLIYLIGFGLVGGGSLGEVITGRLATQKAGISRASSPLSSARPAPHGLRGCWYRLRG